MSAIYLDWNENLVKHAESRFHVLTTSLKTHFNDNTIKIGIQPLILFRTDL